MKSKTYKLNDDERLKKNKTSSFIGLYKTAADTNVILSGKSKLDKKDSRKNIPDTNNETDKHDSVSTISNKKKRKEKQNVQLTQITIDGRSFDSRLDKEELGTKEDKVKSIMKTSSTRSGHDVDEFTDTSSVKRKKRNKSVSFMIDESEEVAVKKTKASDSVENEKSSNKSAKNKLKLSKEQRNAHEKENRATENLNTVKYDTLREVAKEKKSNNLAKDKKKHSEMDHKLNQGYIERTIKNEAKLKIENLETQKLSPLANEGKTELGKRKVKKVKKDKLSSIIPGEIEMDQDKAAELKDKKHKKKKRKVKHVTADAAEIDGEPQKKTRKRDIKTDITEDLENLSIGDNAHTLSNLLDEMTVVDKTKKKKIKSKHKKVTKSVSSSDNTDLEKIEEGKEKITWKKRKWNKDRKGLVSASDLLTSVIIENLPLTIIMIYKRLLTEHFAKAGMIKKIGVVETYPTDDSKPVFTTTVYFDSEAAATKALEDDNTMFEGNFIRVKRPLPPTETTIALKSHADLNEQNISSILNSAGRIRSIRILTKHKKSSSHRSIAFVEFDGPAAADRALKMSEDARIGGKKVYLSRFEQRGRKYFDANIKNIQDSDNEGDSEDSND